MQTLHKKLLAFLAGILLAGAALAQSSGGGAVSTGAPLTGARGTTPPATCVVGQLFFDTDATAGSNVLGCTAANTWTAQGASGITIGTTAITGGATTQVLYNLAGVVSSDAGFTRGSTAGQGITIAAGTATTDVAALSVTRTNNNAAVATGVKFTFTDTTSAAGFLPFQVLGGAAGSTNLLSLSKAGSLTLGVAPTLSSTSGNLTLDAPSGEVQIGSPNFRVSTTGTLYTNNFVTSFGILNAGRIIHGTAPTIASGGCTSPTVTNANGTAYFTIDVGTSCSGSQPVVFTLPAATTGWNCYARNVTNGATSAPAQTGAVSTTSVTITNFARTTGVAAAWTDGDDVVVSCLGG